MEGFLSVRKSLVDEFDNVSTEIMWNYNIIGIVQRILIANPRRHNYPVALAK